MWWQQPDPNPDGTLNVPIPGVPGKEETLDTTASILTAEGVGMLIAIIIVVVIFRRLWANRTFAIVAALLIGMFIVAVIVKQ